MSWNLLECCWDSRQQLRVCPQCGKKSGASDLDSEQSLTLEKMRAGRHDRRYGGLRLMSKYRIRTRSSIPEPKTKEYTLIVLGASKVGKTALVGQFLWDGFVSVYKPTVEEFNWIEYVNESGSILVLQVIDTSGSHDFLAMRHLYSQTGDAFVVVFAVDDPDSAEEAKRIISDIKQRNKKKAPILLLANKCDLYANESEWPCQKMRTYALNNRLTFAAITAKNSVKVEKVFRDLLNRMQGFSPTEMKKRRQSMPSTRAYSGVDVNEIEQIVKSKTRGKNSCTVS